MNYIARMELCLYLRSGPNLAEFFQDNDRFHGSDIHYQWTVMKDESLSVIRVKFRSAIGLTGDGRAYLGASPDP